MPKDKKIRPLAFGCSRVSPYPCSSSVPENPIGLGFGEADVDHVQVWQDARCPICMENPHNAVLLRCSSFEKGCRPFMCNTSYRHSNCLDQFCKPPVSSPSTTTLNMTEGGSDMHRKLFCPLCRGQIRGWFVIGSARGFMNNKSRTCSTETCDFKGTYNELRKHARSDHPNVRPTEVDSDLQLNWTRFERERDYEDVLSSIQPGAEDVNNEIVESLLDLEEIFHYVSYELGSMIHWRHRSTQSERDFRGRRQNSRSSGGRGFRRRTPRMSTFNNIGQIFNNGQ